jgi:hypothetical protein
VDFDVAAVHDTHELTVTSALVVTGTDEQVGSATSIAEPGQGVTRRAVCALSFPPSGRYESRITVGAPSGVLASFSGPELIVTD